MIPSVRKSRFFSLVKKKNIFSEKNRVFFITEEKTGFLEKKTTNLWVLDALGTYIHTHTLLVSHIYYHLLYMDALSHICYHIYVYYCIKIFVCIFYIILYVYEPRKLFCTKRN